MKFKVVVIDLEIPRRWKRPILLVGALVVVLTSAAASALLPHTFVANEVLTAEALNETFQSLDARATTIEGRTEALSGLVSALEKRLSGDGRYSGSAKFCGATTTKFTGNVGSYAGAQAACKVACGNSPTAHMCTSDEFVRSVTVGLGDRTACSGGCWYSAFAWSSDASNAYPQNECLGYTNTNSFWYGPIAVWGYPQVEVWHPEVALCSTQHPIACCE